MNDDEQIPRSRGAVCGVLLILLGLWGGLAPFAGPYVHFGYTPDTAWHYDSGRLYYSAIPGAVALLGGVLIILTRNRVVGTIGGVLGVLGGAWFAVGVGFVNDLLNRAISAGGPIVRAGGSLRYQYLETISLFAGLGILIVLAGAIAIGRFSMVAAKDLAAADDGYQAPFPTVPSATRPDLNQYSTSTSASPASSPPFAPAPFPDTAQIPQSEP